MEINYSIIAIIIFAVVVVILILIRRNKKDQRDLEDKLNNQELPTEEHPKDEV